MLHVPQGTSQRRHTATWTGTGSGKQSQTSHSERTKVKFFQISQLTAPLASYAELFTSVKAQVPDQSASGLIRISLQCIFEILKETILVKLVFLFKISHAVSKLAFRTNKHSSYFHQIQFSKSSANLK